MSNDTSVILAGGKTGVLVLHDLVAQDAVRSADEISRLAQYLNACGLTVAAPQLGQRIGDAGGPATASALIRQSEIVLARLKERCNDLVVMGVSYGSMLALEVARQNKATVQAVVMVEPRAWLPGMRLPIAPGITRHMRQAWIAEAVGKVRAVLQPTGSSNPGGMLGRIQGLVSSPRDAAGMSNRLVSTGQILDCLHATLPEIRQPVLVIRHQDAPRAVVDSSIMLQRRLGGRVESGVLDSISWADANADRRQEIVADRVSRFLSAVISELATRRDIELRRQKMGTGRSNAA